MGSNYGRKLAAWEVMLIVAISLAAFLAMCVGMSEFESRFGARSHSTQADDCGLRGHESEVTSFFVHP